MKDLNDLIAQAQSAAETVQKQMAEAQATLDKIEVEGASGGGLVKVRATAKGRVIGVDIDESLLAGEREADAGRSDRRGVQRLPDQGRCRVPGRNGQDDAGPAAATGVQAAVLKPLRIGNMIGVRLVSCTVQQEGL